jgi:C2 domain.
MSLFPGTLSIRPISAKLLHNTEHFGKMAPYVKIKIGNHVEKTRAAKKMHMEPSWDEELIFNITDETMIDIEVKHKELIHDDLIGTASLSLNTWLNSNNFSFSEWVPLFYKEKDAGSLLLEMRFTPDAGFGAFNKNVGAQSTNLGTQQSTQNVVLGPVTTGVSQPASQTTVSQTTFVEKSTLEPILHSETVHVQEQPVFIKENPLVYEKEILRERPLITEKEIIQCTQPIVIEKPELREHLIHQVQNPTIVQEQPVFRSEAPLHVNQRPVLEGTPIIQKEQEFYREEAQIFHERPELYKKEIITEKPIIHEKDIIHVEKPVIVEKPEIIQREYDYIEKGEVVREQPLIHAEQTVYATEEPMIRDQPIIHQEQAELIQTNPTYIQERPEVYEKQIIHEKPIIHEQNILHTQKEIIHEKPEVLQTRILHQEQPILRQEPVQYQRQSDQMATTTTTTITSTLPMGQKLRGDNNPLSP